MRHVNSSSTGPGNEASISSATADPIIAFQEVTYSVKGRSATLLSQISMAVNSGETLVLLGRSGSGKTTLLRLINRMLAPSSGQVVVEGKSTTDWDAIRLRRHIGYVIQEAGLFPHFTVAENVGLVPKLERWDPARIAARTNELLQIVGLDPKEFASRRPAQLSGGQRQRVGVARALGHAQRPPGRSRAPALRPATRLGALASPPPRTACGPRRQGRGDCERLDSQTRLGCRS